METPVAELQASLINQNERPKGRIRCRSQVKGKCSSGFSKRWCTSTWFAILPVSWRQRIPVVLICMFPTLQLWLFTCITPQDEQVPFAWFYPCLCHFLLCWFTVTSIRRQSRSIKRSAASLSWPLKYVFPQWLQSRQLGSTSGPLHSYFSTT